jgi:hypothetical protein
LACIEPAVEAHLVMVIHLQSAMDAQALEARRDPLVLRNHHAAVAVATQVLRREEAEGPDRRDFTRHAAFAVDHARRANRLRGVLDDRNAARPGRDVFDRRHLAEQVDGNDRLRLARARGRGGSGHHVEGRRVDVAEDRLRAHVVHGSGRREERERCRDHLIATADVEGTEREQDRVRTVRAADGVLRPGERGDGLLEAFDRFAENEELSVDDAHHRGYDVILDGRVLSTEIE